MATTTVKDGEKTKSLVTRFKLPPSKWCSCCRLSSKRVTSLLSWAPKALFASGGVFILLGSVLVGLGSMENVKYPQGLPVGIPFLVFGVGMIGLCVGALVLRHKRESRGIGLRTFDGYSKEALNLSLGSSFSSGLPSSRAVQYFPSGQRDARSSIEAAPPEGISTSARSDPAHIRSMTGTPVMEESGVTNTGTGFYYVADVTNPAAGYYVHSETGDTYHVNEMTGEYCLVDANGAESSVMGTFSRRSSLSSYQMSTRPGSAAGRPASAMGRPSSGSTIMSSASRLAQKTRTPRIRPGSSTGRRALGVNFDGEVSVAEIDNTGGKKVSSYRQQLKKEDGNGTHKKALERIFADPFGDDNFTLSSRPRSARRPRTGRARSAVVRSSEPNDENTVTAEVHVHRDQVDTNGSDFLSGTKNVIKKIYVQSERKSIRKYNTNGKGSDVDSSLGNSISSLPSGRLSSTSNHSESTKNRFSENFEVRT